MRRYSMRLDGFVSINAPLAGGEAVTKPIRFAGKKLTLNFASSAAGDIRVELQDAQGRAIPGFGLDACPPLFGDTLDRSVTSAVWPANRSGSDSSSATPTSIRSAFPNRTHADPEETFFCPPGVVPGIRDSRHAKGDWVNLYAAGRINLEG
jgi:hypothetical protein